MALVGGAGLIGFGLVFGDLLYLHEIALLIGLGAAGLVVSWNVGALKVFSKLTRDKGWTVFCGSRRCAECGTPSKPP